MKLCQRIFSLYNCTDTDDCAVFWQLTNELIICQFLPDLNGILLYITVLCNFYVTKLLVRNTVKITPEFLSYKMRLIGENQSLMFLICGYLL